MKTKQTCIHVYISGIFSVNFHINNMIEECACPVPCTMVDYQTQLSSAVFPSNNFYDVLFEGGKIPESHRLARQGPIVVSTIPLNFEYHLVTKLIKLM